MVNITIDGKTIEVSTDDTILDIARKESIYIPSLCYLKGVNEQGDCRMCLVKTDDSPYLKPACKVKASDNLNVITSDEEIDEARKTILSLIISNHHFDCANCVRGGLCELQKVMKKLGVHSSNYKGEKKEYAIDDLSPSIVRDFNKCILCKRCVSTCSNIQNINAIEVMNRGFDSIVDTTNSISLNDVNCTFCGQCINNCPTGALREKDGLDIVFDAINDPDKIVFVQTAPSIRVALGEEFGMEIGTNVTGKMVTALKQLNFDYVFDTNVGADFTIMEEANELTERIKGNKTFPMITSCSPAWVRFIEKHYPKLLPHLSSCKSPHLMLGSIIKTYYAEKKGIDPKNIFMVSVMPCISKKLEIEKPGSNTDGLKDVDAVITTRELARILKKKNIDFITLEDTPFDDPLGEATGAGAIFGATGGVMEAALRTTKDLLGEVSEKIVFEEVRGGALLKTADIVIRGKKYKVAVASGLKEARKLLDDISSGLKNYDFIEIMACPGGCIMGGGQPIVSSDVKSLVDVRAKRASVIYNIDEKSAVRKSHENPVLQKIYLEYVGKPGKEKAHKMFHTHHVEDKEYNFN